MASLITQPSGFIEKTQRAIYNLRHIEYFIGDIERSARDGDERCARFLKQNKGRFDTIEDIRMGWVDEARDIARAVERDEAKEHNKTHCDVCGKWVKDIKRHSRTSISHKGRLKVIELDNDPNWERAQSIHDVCEMILQPKIPSIMDPDTQWKWTHNEKKMYHEAKAERAKEIGDIVLQHPYEYSSSGREVQWVSQGGGKWWAKPHIVQYASFFKSVMRQIRKKHNKQYGTSFAIVEDFHSTVDPFIRNPNSVRSRAALLALQLNQEED